MFKQVTTAFFVLTFAIAPTISHAQRSFCDLETQDWSDEIDDLLVGTWEVQNGPGLASVGGIPVPLPPDSVGQMTIAKVGSELTAIGKGAELAADFSVDYVPDEVWDFKKLIDFDDNPPYISLEDAAITFDQDCPSALPRIRFSASIPIQGGNLMITMDMVVVGETTLFGVSDFVLTAGGPVMVAQRSMIFAKN